MEKGIEHICGNPTYSGGHFLPPADNTYDLGSATMAWRNFYIDTLIYVTGTVMQGDFLPSAQGTYDIGSSTYPWAELYIGNTSDYLKAIVVSNVPTLYGMGAYLRIGDAATTQHSLNAEDDLMVTGELEVVGASFLDGAVALTNTLTIGSDGTGYDVLFYSATANCFWEWDEDQDRVDQAAVFGNATGNESAYVLTITDSSTASADMHRGIVVDLTSSGAKTGSAHIECFSADMYFTANTPETYGMGIYAYQSGAPTLGNVFGIDIYFEDLGANVTGNLLGMQITMNGTNKAASRHSNLRLTTVGTEIKSALLVDAAAEVGIDMTYSLLSTADIIFHHGTTLLDDGTDLTLAGANLVLGSGLTLGGTVTGGNQTVNNLGHIGLANNAASTADGIYYSETKTITDNAPNRVLFGSIAFAKTSAVYSGTSGGIRVNPAIDSTNTQNWTADPIGLSGVHTYMNTEASSAGTITGIASFYASQGNFANAATVTNLYGLYVATPQVAGSKVTNEYGIYIANQNTGDTLNYAIYTGTGLVRFGGQVEVPAAGIKFSDTSVQTKASTREFSVPCHYGANGAVETALGDFHVWELDATDEYVHFNFKVPHDFTTLTHVKVLGIKGTNGTIDWTATTDFGAIGEAYTTHSDSDTANGLAMTANEIEEVDISVAFTGVAAGDFVGVKFNLDAIGAGQYNVIELVFKYT